MFLPIVLMRDFGFWGFLAFAAPNVIGAAAVGWVVKSPEGASRLLKNHALAIGFFSAITIAFHVYWLAWIGSWLPDVLGLNRSVAATIIAIALAFLVALNVVSRRSVVAAGVPLWLLSALLIITLIGTGSNNGTMPPSIDDTGLALLAPVMVFGFALCPYLDGTFLTARASLTNRQAKIAFGVGFGVLFLAMIVGTVLYAPLLSPAFQGVTAAQWIGAFLLIHMLFQALFSITVHRRLSPLSTVPVFFTFGLLIVSAFGAVLATRLAPYSGLSAGEVGYRVFLGFYGLVFPAYVWLVMIPDAQGVPVTRHTMRVYAAAVGIALPMFWMGFVERQEFWLAPGLLVVLFARLFIRGTKVQAPSSEHRALSTTPEPREE